MGKTRYLFKEIKEMTGSRSSSCGAMKLSYGRMVSEENDIKKRWQQYTENLYRRDPNINDIFNENLYEDELDVLEIEVKEAIRHILYMIYIIENLEAVTEYIYIYIYIYIYSLRFWT